jgi:hypothetical protein
MFSEHGIDALQHPKNVGLLTKAPFSFVPAARQKRSDHFYGTARILLNAPAIKGGRKW